jgi:hypothetical protein
MGEVEMEVEGKTGMTERDTEEVLIDRCGEAMQ